MSDIPQADERVLSTLNRDGSRRWLRPRVSTGRFLTARRVVAYGLIVVFTAVPYLRMNGKPLVLLDILNREFTLFGTTYLPTDTLLLALFMLSVFITIFLLTALLGRVWCGWACPQTVYMEFLYRPFERLFEGRHYRSGGTAPLPTWRRIAKYVVFFLCSVFLAHTFLAYFVGVEQLLQWVRRSPFEHPTAFVVMAATTGLMMFDFCFFREQVCTLMCPYGRLQSVMLDRNSLIISYDESRGEPRGRIARKTDLDAPARGDCIDCKLCVTTCPTGIDIRQGLQMECIGCAQCIDACDAVMDKVNRPRGLIRYSSQEAMETGRRRLVRPRVIIYPVLLLGALVSLGFVAAARSSVDLVFLRTRSKPYVVLDSGDVEVRLQAKLTNRTDVAHTYEIVPLESDEMTSQDLPVTVEPTESGTVTLRLVIDADRYELGRAEVTLLVTDETGAEKRFRTGVPGPLFAGPRPKEDDG